MKRILTLAVLPLLCLSACSNASDEEKIEKFNAKLQAVVDDYRTKVEAFQADTTLTMDKLAEAIEATSETAMEQMQKICIKTIKSNRNSEVAVEALKNIYYELPVDELEKLIAGLGSKVKESDFIQQLSASIDSKKATAEGQMFTDFEVDGVKFSDFVGKGKVVLVDFWASWCGPCKREIPNIADVYAKYAGEDFDVLSIAVWDRPEDTVAAAKEHGVVWSQIINAQRIPTDIYGIDGIPHIMLVGADGTILKRDLRGSAIEEAVREALGR